LAPGGEIAGPGRSALKRSYRPQSPVSVALASVLAFA